MARKAGQLEGHLCPKQLAWLMSDLHSQSAGTVKLATMWYMALRMEMEGRP